MTDSVKFQRKEQEPKRIENVEELLKSASERYLKIRADLVRLDDERFAIVDYIKSFPDWEYFIDNFAVGDGLQFYSKFNSVRILGDIVILLYEPIHYRNDKNNCAYCNCRIEDILNIETIIEKRKKYYENK